MFKKGDKIKDTVRKYGQGEIINVRKPSFYDNFTLEVKFKNLPQTVWYLTNGSMFRSVEPTLQHVKPLFNKKSINKAVYSEVFGNGKIIEFKENGRYPVIVEFNDYNRILVKDFDVYGSYRETESVDFDIR